ncbi:MAG: hypothetical protein ACE5MK_00905 [Acidobacteriota bacterium]
MITAKAKDKHDHELTHLRQLARKQRSAESRHPCVFALHRLVRINPMKSGGIKLVS